MRIEEAIKAYRERFGENYPIHHGGCDEKEIIKDINKCLEKGEKAVPKEIDYRENEYY